MAKITPLKAGQLGWSKTSVKIPWADSGKIPLPSGKQPYHNPFQPRVMEALEMAMRMRKHNRHVFLCGYPGYGRTHILKAFLESRTKNGAVPNDLVFLPNFEDEDRPTLVSLHPGDGKKFASLMKEFLESLDRLIKDRFRSSAYAAKKDKLHSIYSKSRSRLLNRMASMAKEAGFDVELEQDGEIHFYPAENAKNAAEAVAATEKDNFSERFAKIARELEKVEEAFANDGKSLDKEAIVEVIAGCFKKFREKIAKKFAHPVLERHLQNLLVELEKNYPDFLLSTLSREEELAQKQISFSPDFFRKYGVNVFVDNGTQTGMPVIFENNPTYANLLGCMEREAEMGSLVTNFSLIRSGSLHRANGGFLILHMRDLLERPGSFDGLLRALDVSSHKMDDGPDDGDFSFRPKSLRPDPISLNVTVIIVGEDEDYEWLPCNDERFARLFRIKAHLATDVERNAANTRQFLLQIAQMIKANSLLPFNNASLAGIIEFASWLCEDKSRLSLHYAALKDYLQEASSLALEKGLDMVPPEILEEAASKKIFRENLLENDFLQFYERQIVKIETSGKAIGKINALTVIEDGDFEFGLPSPISCAVGVGHDGIIDLEREVEMGGPIHSKAMMILKNYLISHFANKNPIILSGSLYFEQNYVGVEGDSASGAELAVIISAISRVPLRQDLAFTGSVNQNGDILAVGGVTAKIEGFFKVCQHQGFTGSQGVIMPATNLENLFLSNDARRQIEAGNFFIYPVHSIEEALTLLTGLKIGRLRKNLSYSPNSLFAKVDERLQMLGNAYQHPFKNVKNGRS